MPSEDSSNRSTQVNLENLKMKLVVSALVLVLLAIASCEADKPSGPVGQQQELRQGRSISGNGNSNMIEHSSGKSRIEQEKRQVQEFLTTKNIFKSIMKLLFGNQEEISATSRHVLGMVGKVSVQQKLTNQTR